MATSACCRVDLATLYFRISLYFQIYMIRQTDAGNSRPFVACDADRGSAQLISNAACTHGRGHDTTRFDQRPVTFLRQVGFFPTDVAGRLSAPCVDRGADVCRLKAAGLAGFAMCD